MALVYGSEWKLLCRYASASRPTVVLPTVPQRSSMSPAARLMTISSKAKHQMSLSAYPDQRSLSSSTKFLTGPVPMRYRLSSRCFKAELSAARPLMTRGSPIFPYRSAFSPCSRFRQPLSLQQFFGRDTAMQRYALIALSALQVVRAIPVKNGIAKISGGKQRSFFSFGRPIRY
jgi:hypothetical protein